jgi:hypothetical protein
VLNGCETSMLEVKLMRLFMEGVSERDTDGRVGSVCLHGYAIELPASLLSQKERTIVIQCTCLRLT